jgi:hypothetical protein
VGTAHREVTVFRSEVEEDDLHTTSNSLHSLAAH